jgi:hypothetical protein
MVPIKFSKIRFIKLGKHSCRIDYSIPVAERLIKVLPWAEPQEWRQII